VRIRRAAKINTMNGSLNPEAVDADDIDLIGRYFNDGDREAMACLFERYSGVAYRIALGETRNSADAEDVVQAAFMNVLSKGHHVNSNVRGWIMSVVVNACRDKMKEESRRRNRQEAVAQDEPASSVANEESDELVTTSIQIVKNLPPLYRLPVSLHFLEGFSVQEVARTLSIPEPTVRTQLHRGLEQIRQSLASAGLVASLVLIPELLKSAQLTPAPARLAASCKSMMIKDAGASATAPVASEKVKRVRSYQAKASHRNLFISVGVVASCVILLAVLAVLKLNSHSQTVPGISQGDPAAASTNKASTPDTPKILTSAASSLVATEATRAGTPPAAPTRPLRGEGSVSSSNPAEIADTTKTAAAREDKSLLDEVGEPPAVPVIQAFVDYHDLQYWDNMTDKAKKWTARNDESTIHPSCSPSWSGFTTTVSAKNRLVAALRALEPGEKSGSVDYELHTDGDVHSATVWRVTQEAVNGNDLCTYCSRVREYLLTLAADGSVTAGTMVHDWSASGPPVATNITVDADINLDDDQAPAQTASSKQQADGASKEKEETLMKAAQAKLSAMTANWFGNHHLALDIDALEG